MIIAEEEVSISEIFAALTSVNATVYFVCDGASGKAARTMIEDGSYEQTPLIGDEFNSPLGAYGPWLFKINDAQQLNKSLSLFLNEPSGWFFVTDQSIGDARRFLKRLTYARLPDGAKVLFRYFDPRIMAAVLRMNDLTQQQIRLLFNHVYWYIVRGVDGRVLKFVGPASDPQSD